MNPLFPVMVGGALGAGLRYVIGTGLSTRLGSSFPYGTLGVNLIGGLCMGVLMGVIAKGGAGEASRLFLGVGVLGGFTTFSAFSLDCWKLIENGQYGLSFFYMSVSVFGALGALMMGLWCARSFA